MGTRHPVKQYPGKQGQPGAGCPDCPMDYTPAENGSSGNGTHQRVAGYSRSMTVKQANPKMKNAK